MGTQKDERFRVAPLGEFYEDLLKIDSWINGRSMAAQANSLLCAKLMQRQAEIFERINYLAKKRNMSADALWDKILSGEAEKLSALTETEND